VRRSWASSNPERPEDEMMPTKTKLCRRISIIGAIACGCFVFMWALGWFYINIVEAKGYAPDWIYTEYHIAPFACISMAVISIFTALLSLKKSN
jgi:hypothetical protein